MASLDDKFKKQHYRIDRVFAQSPIKLVKKTLVRSKDGKKTEVKINANTPNQERLNDAMIYYFQQQVNKVFNYYNLREEALKELKEKFEEHNLNKPSLSYKESRLRAASIQQVIDKKILDHFESDPVVEMSMDQLLEIATLKSANTFKLQVAIIKSLIERSPRAIKRDIVDLDKLEIKVTALGDRQEIIGVDFLIDKDMGQYFDNIDDLVKAKINPIDKKAFRNKRKYIEAVRITFSKEVLPFIVCQGTDYVAIYNALRAGFKYQHTYGIDTYISSIQHAQKYKHLTDFTPEELQSHFGYSFGRFNQFLTEIIDTAIEDMNSVHKRKVSYILKRKGYDMGDTEAPQNVPIEYFRWVITDFEDSLRDGTNDIAYYVAIEILKKDHDIKNNMENIKNTAIALEPQLATDLPNITIIDGKQVSEWIKEATVELEAEVDLQYIFQTNNIEGYYYDYDLMSVIDLNDVEASKIMKPSDSLAFIREKCDIKEKKQRTLFPKNDKELIGFILKSTLKLQFYSPVHFYFTIANYYIESRDKKTDWKKIINAWLTNGKYNPRKEYSRKIQIEINNELYAGELNLSSESIYTDDDILIEGMSIDVIAEKIADESLRMYL